MVNDMEFKLAIINSKFVDRLRQLNLSSFKEDNAGVMYKEWKKLFQNEIANESNKLEINKKESSWIKGLKNEDEISISKLTQLFIEDIVFWMKSVQNVKEMKVMKLKKKNGKSLTHHAKEIPIPRRYFFGLCPSSFNILSDPKVCSGCLSIGYFSKEDQKLDWKEHKSTCKIIQTIVKAGVPGLHPLSQDPGAKSKQLQLLLTNTFGRALTQDETDMLNYPRLCAVCMSGKQSSMIHCPNCQSVSYCSDPHLEEDREEHSKSCPHLKICLEDYRLEQIHNDHPSTSFLPRCSRFGYEPLPKEGIYDFLEPEMSIILKESVARIPSETRYLSFHYTCPLTILYGLQESLQDLSERESLIIEIVGARVAEMNDLSKWEIIPLRLPKLKNISFIFIGPEIESDSIGSAVEGGSQYLQSIRPDLTQNFYCHRMDYETFYKKEAKKSPSPDLVAVLNCGFIFYSSWDSSIPLMISRGSSLLFTEYYEEDAGFNLDKIEDLWTGDIQVILEPQANPYCSALPARIPTGFHFRQFKRRNYVMSNDYICIVSKE